MFLVLLSALFGLWIGGSKGFLLGAIAGFVLRHFARAAERKRLSEVHSRFIDTTFAVMGALCKADGTVTRDEIRVAEHTFERLRLSPEQKTAAKAAFNRGKAPGFDLDAEVGLFAQTVPRGSILFHLFLQLQLLAVAADGEVHPAEHAMLVRVARRLGLGEFHVAQLEALLRSAAGAAPASRATANKQRLDDAYAALGVTPEASESEIKRAYRKMISEHHPDKLAAKGLPESMRQFAEERAREINAAYDLIKKARRFG